MKDLLKIPSEIGTKITLTTDKVSDVLVKVTDKESGIEIINKIITVAKVAYVRVATSPSERSLIVESYPITTGVAIKQSFSFIRPRYIRNYNMPKWNWHPGGTSAQQQSSSESGAFILLEGDTNGTAFLLQEDGAGKIKLQD